MKRGQLSIFIIIGLILVLSVGSIIYLNAQRARSGAVPLVEQVAEFAQPVQDYVNACLERIGREGLQSVGDHGGYLSVRNIRNVRLNPVEPTDSDALFLAPDGEYAIPYWWYLSSKNDCDGDCAFSTKQPPLYTFQGESSIEAQLEGYVEENIDNCLKEFTPLAIKGLSVSGDDDREVNVIVTDTSVAIAMEQEVTAEGPSSRTRLNSFVVQLPVHLKDIYDLANNITVMEKENSFLGKHSRQLISSFSQMSPTKLPPVGAVDIQLGPGTIWVKRNVEQDMIDILQQYVPLLQVFGTRNYRPVETPRSVTNQGTVENALNRNALIPNLKPFPDLEARLTYIDAWKPYFDLNCRGEICRAESFMNTFGFVFGIQRYSFAYDLSYPVIVEIQEPDAFNGLGYTFRFALEGNLRNNEPLTSDWESAEAPEYTTQGSQLCNEEYRTSGLVNITLRDTTARSNLDGAITFQCGIERCTIGQTEDGKLSTRLPPCLGGRLTAVVPDYVSDVLSLNTGDASVNIAIPLNPVIEVNVTVDKYRLRKDSATRNWALDDFTVPFSQYDQSIITLLRKADPEQDTFSSFASVCGSSFRQNDPLSKDMKLTAGNYSVLIATLYHGNITIPVDKRCYSYRSGLSRKRKCFNIPEAPISFGNNNVKNCASENPLPTSNIEFTWEVTPDMLRAKHVTFKTLVMGAEIPGTTLIVEDLDQLSAAQRYVDAEPRLVVPEVSP